MLETDNNQPLGQLGRAEILKRIESRQQEIQEKRRLWEELTLSKQSDSHHPQHEAENGAAAALQDQAVLANLLDSVNTAIAAVPPPELGPHSLSPATLPADSGPAATKASVKSVRIGPNLRGGPLGKSLAVNQQTRLTIEPAAVSHFDKSAQADILPAATAELEDMSVDASGDGGVNSRVKAEELFQKNVRRFGASPFKAAAVALAEASQTKTVVADGGDLKTAAANAPTAAVNGTSPADAVVVVEETDEEKALLVKQAKVLTDEEKRGILTSRIFGEFFQRSTKVVERSLGNRRLADVFADYSGVTEADDEQASLAEPVKQLEVYQDNKWSNGRPITDIRCSPAFNDLFLCSYGQKKNASITDPDGCVLVWSLPLNNRPEYVFSCQSAVCTALWDTFRPNIIIGGTYTGSIVVWDTRAKTRPVQRSPLAAKSHCHPVYAMEIVGTQHAHNLVSVDNDGRLCLWSLNMLVYPTETLDLKKGAKDQQTSVLSIAFAEGETNTFFGGTEDGSIFQGHIHGSKVGVTQSFEGEHSGPVTSLQWHPTIESQAADFSDLLLSASVDWTVKLWCPKNQSQAIQSFEASEDYVFDAKWHPSNPGIFASCDAASMLDLWDMSKDMEMPIVRTQTSSAGLSRVCWSQDGRKVFTGNDEGQLGLWGVSNDICTPKPEDITRLEEKLEEMRQSDAPKAREDFE